MLSFASIFEKKQAKLLDRANAACMSHAPPTFNYVTVFSPPIIADFCAHLFSFCVALAGAFAAYPFIFAS